MTENLAAFLSSSSSSSSVQVENFEECINITSVFKSMSLYLIHWISIDRSCSFQNVLFKKKASIVDILNKLWSIKSISKFIIYFSELWKEDLDQIIAA